MTSTCARRSSDTARAGHSPALYSRLDITKLSVIMKRHERSMSSIAKSHRRSTWREAAEEVARYRISGVIAAPASKTEPK
eukprot:2589425-Pyramimonas_sp.AAC.1